MRSALMLLALLGQVDVHLSWSNTVESSPKQSLKEAVSSYVASGGQMYYTSGKSDRDHLIQDHGWTSDSLVGLTQRELMYLHGATHVGQISPQDYIPNKPSPLVTDGPTVHRSESKRPVVFMYSPPGEYCHWCNQAERHDWSGYPFRIVKVEKEGFRAYPVFHIRATKPGTNHGYYYGFNPKELLAAWKARN